MDAYWTWAPYSLIWPKVPSSLSFLYFTCHFCVFFLHFLYVFVLFFLHFWHVCIISFKFLNWKMLYFKVQLTKRPPAPFSRSNSEVDFCPFVSCFEGRIQYWSFETKYSVQYWGSPLCPLCQRMVEYLGT